MSILQDLLALTTPVSENHDEWEAMHAAQADEFHGQREATTSEIAQADEFSVEHDSDDMVHLMDGERSVRVSMPYHVWVELCQDTVHRHAVR